MEENKVKSLAPVTCPYCDQHFTISFNVIAPTINDTLTPEIIDKAKEQLKHMVGTLGLEDSEFMEVCKWIDAEETIFGPNEVDELFISIKER